MFSGCHTALVTPMKGKNAEAVDFKALEQLVEFQVASGVSGILAVGTTGESPTLTWEEHSQVIEKIKEFSRDRCTVIAGTGSNCTREAMDSTRRAARHNITAALLVEPYYNGPSSLEIRKEYIGPIAAAFPDVQLIPYVIPGRSGTQLLPEDLGLLHREYKNVNAVKEASGDLDNMRRTRLCCGPSLEILSGDDGLTFEMMTDPSIGALGVISVTSNIAPAGVQQLTQAVLDGNMDEARRLNGALKPLFDLVTVKTQEPSPWGERLTRARNPVPCKTLMRILGMPVGKARRPLGRMTRRGLDVLLEGARTVWKNSPELLEPLVRTFDVDIEERLCSPPDAEELIYRE